jgi:hypothetical protein
LLAGELGDDFKAIFIKWHNKVKHEFLDKVFEDSSLIQDKQFLYLRDVLNLDKGYNSEIKRVWYLNSLKLSHDEITKNGLLKDFLTSYGSMGNVRSLFRAFASLNKEAAYKLFTELK